MIKPKYDLDKIKYATDAPTFEKAMAICESGGVKDFRDNDMSEFLARVRGSGGDNYEVFVSARRHDEASRKIYPVPLNLLSHTMVLHKRGLRI